MKRSVLATLSKRRQLTLPADVARELGVHAGDKVEFTIEDGHVELRPARTFTARTLAGSVPIPEHLRGVPMKEQIRMAMDEHAEDVVREMREREGR
jgi:AbrB family looped-hinge helix DNA binding protein